MNQFTTNIPGNTAPGFLTALGILWLLKPQKVKLSWARVGQAAVFTCPDDINLTDSLAFALHGFSDIISDRNVGDTKSATFDMLEADWFNFHKKYPDVAVGLGRFDGSQSVLGEGSKPKKSKDESDDSGDEPTNDGIKMKVCLADKAPNYTNQLNMARGSGFQYNIGSLVHDVKLANERGELHKLIQSALDWKLTTKEVKTGFGKKEKNKEFDGYLFHMNSYTTKFLPSAENGWINPNRVNIAGDWLATCGAIALKTYPHFNKVRTTSVNKDELFWPLWDDAISYEVLDIMLNVRVVWVGGNPVYNWTKETGCFAVYGSEIFSYDKTMTLASPTMYYDGRSA
jgi:hypothetical protein